MDSTSPANPPGSLVEITVLEDKVKNSLMPSDLAEKARGMIQRAQVAMRYGGYFTGLEQVANYIDWIANLPWKSTTQDILDNAHAQEILNKSHYGLSMIKDRIIEYLSVLSLKQKQAAEIATPMMRAPILCFVGLVGTGKTTIAYSIAEAMGRKFIRIPFGGMGSALDLRGESRSHPDAEPGQVIKALRRSGTKNPVLLLDEIDRVAEHARADIMGVLIELLDPEQNQVYVDHYIDYPFDLSEVLFVATANNTTHISTAVLDRLEPIQMPSYSDEEKIAIGRDYVFSKFMLEAGLSKDNLTIDDETWLLIVSPLCFK